MPEKQDKRIADFFNKIDSGAVQPPELIASIKIVMAIIKEKTTSLLQLITKNKTETDSKLATLSANLNTSVQQLNELVNSKDSKTRATLERELKYVWEQIKMLVETMPKEYDESPMHEMMEEIKKSIPKIDNTELDKLKQKLNDLKIKDIDGLEEALKKLIKQQSKAGTYTTPPAALYRPLHETHTVNSGTTSVQLSQGVSAEGTAIFVRYQGQMLDLGEHYTVSGNRVTFDNDIEFVDGTTISITYWP
jgi:hypothetical protein